MAMEYKTLNIKNSEEDSSIQNWSRFGWVLKSSQRVYNKDSHIETKGDQTYSVTETVDFTKLVFERDKSMPNYDRIAKLEREYLAAEAEVASFQAPKNEVKSYSSIEDYGRSELPIIEGKGTLMVLLTIAGALMAIAGLFVNTAVLHWILLIGGAVLFIASLIIIKPVKRKAVETALGDKNSKLYEKLKSAYQSHQARFAEYHSVVSKHENNKRRLGEIISELDTLV